jgi:hypothetical protein
MQGMNMDRNDEAELRRLTNLLSQISKKDELTEDDKEALKKAALALSVSFIHGHRKEIEEIYNNLDKKLTVEQKQYLRSLGLKND